jgi:hypothetical protein
MSGIQSGTTSIGDPRKVKEDTPSKMLKGTVGGPEIRDEGTSERLVKGEESGKKIQEKSFY